VREAIRASREAAAQRAVAVEDERRQRDALPARHERLAEDRRLVGEAQDALASRRAALDEAQRRDAAAHAAEGLHAGDLCPVCGRVLDVGFLPPSAGALEPLKRAVREADAALTARRAAETTATNLLDEAARRLAEAKGRREAAGAVAREHLAELHAVAPSADVDLDDAVILGPFDERVRELDGAVQARADEVEEARGRLATARADVQGLLADLDRKARHLARERQRIGEKRTWCAERLRSVPAGLAVREAAGTADLDEAIAAAKARLEDARQRRAELERLQAEVTRLARARSDLQARLRDEVERPRGAAVRSAAGLRLRVDDGLRALDQPPVEAAPRDAELEVEVAWARDLERCAVLLKQQLGEAAAAAETVAVEAAAETGRQLAERGLPDAEALDAESRRVSQELGRVQSEMRTAEAQIPVAADLDSWIATGTEVRDALSELARLLQDAQFVGHVIERRQRQLLIVASRILGSVTGEAYGFAADFEIVDRSTQQPRPTRTLSGGETFLASLALALALVEIAGRSGTQLDALFLDEGFGSLDANALDEALSALEVQASGGRLVAVVSHVRAVAERIETVLEVTRTAAGSRADWRGGAERELMLTAELEGRLLA
jgi:exonuclease SbcC